MLRRGGIIIVDGFGYVLKLLFVFGIRLGLRLIVVDVFVVVCFSFGLCMLGLLDCFVVNVMLLFW